MSNTQFVLQPVMQDTGVQTVQKRVTVETETAAVTLWRASATVRLVTLEHTATRVCSYVLKHLKTTVFNLSRYQVYMCISFHDHSMFQVFVWTSHMTWKNQQNPFLKSLAVCVAIIQHSVFLSATTRRCQSNNPTHGGFNFSVLSLLGAYFVL